MHIVSLKTSRPKATLDDRVFCSVVFVDGNKIGEYSAWRGEHSKDRTAAGSGAHDVPGGLSPSHAVRTSICDRIELRHTAICTQPCSSVVVIIYNVLLKVYFTVHPNDLTRSPSTLHESVHVNDHGVAR